MKAITTKYFGPTNARGSRIQASDMDGNRVTVPYDHALDTEGNHRMACAAFLAKMCWTGDWYGGAVKRGYVFVDTSDQAPIRSTLATNNRTVSVKVSP